MYLYYFNSYSLVVWNNIFTGSISKFVFCIDVPVFMFIAGISYNYIESIGKNIKGILKQWNKWVYFLFFYIVILFIFFRPYLHRTQLINYIFYKVPHSGPLQVVGGSLWFIPIYIKVTIFCSIILHFYNQNKTFHFKYLLMLMLLLSVCNVAFVDSYLAIYSFVYLLGYYSFNNKINSKKLFLVLEIFMCLAIIFVFKLSGYGLRDIQKLKFAPTIYYLLISMPGIIMFWFLKDKLKISKNNPMNYVGKNAIFFYYSQGLSASILYFIEPLISIKYIYIKFLIMAFINIIMAIVMGILFNESYNFSVKKLLPIKDKLLNIK